MRVWETAAEGALSVCVLGSAPSVAKARAALCDALVAELSTDPKPAYVVPEPPLWSRPPAAGASPRAPQQPPWGARARIALTRTASAAVDWSMPGAAWPPYDTGMAPALAPLFPGLMQDAYAPAAMQPMQMQMQYYDPSAGFAPASCGPTGAWHAARAARPPCAPKPPLIWPPLTILPPPSPPLLRPQRSSCITPSRCRMRWWASSSA